MAKKKSPSLEKASNKVLSLKVSLMGTEPLVWRRILVPSNFTLRALHSVIQYSMGWQMSHLYQFEIAGTRYAEPDELGEFDEPEVRSPEIPLSRVLTGAGEIIYTYDFGDGWRHRIDVEDVSKANPVFQYPICVGGANACPPEDCGGIWGFEELKKTILDPDHVDHLDRLHWLGGFYDPVGFDANCVNRDKLWLIDWHGAPDDEGLYLPALL